MEVDSLMGAYKIYWSNYDI